MARSSTAFAAGETGAEAEEPELLLGPDPANTAARLPATSATTTVRASTTKTILLRPLRAVPGSSPSSAGGVVVAKLP